MLAIFLLQTMLKLNFLVGISISNITLVGGIFTQKYLESLLEGAYNYLLSFVYSPLKVLGLL